MKHFALLLSTLCLVALPVVPVQASLIAEASASSTMICLKLLFSDSEAHAAECGGPFEMDKSTTPLVKGTYSPECQVVELAPLTLLVGDDLRTHVATMDPCDLCNASLTQTRLDPTFDGAFRIRVAGC